MIDTSAFTAQMHVAHWGWTIALFLWLVGLSGMGMFINHWLRERRLTWLCAFSAVAGTLLVMSHLTRILNLPAAAIHSLLSMSFNFPSGPSAYSPASPSSCCFPPFCFNSSLFFCTKKVRTLSYKLDLR